VNKELDRQQRMQQKGPGRVPGAFMNDDLMEYSDDDARLHKQMMQERQKMFNNPGQEEMNDEDGLDEALDHEDVKGKLSLWVQKQDVIKWIKKTFTHFLRTFTNEKGEHVNEQRVHQMCHDNKQSLEITFLHLSRRHPTLAIWVAEEPSLILPILNEVALEVTLEVYTEYLNIHNEVFVRIGDLPVEDKLRDLRQIHLNALIKIRGVVTKRTGVFPELNKMFFRCQCGDIKGPFFNTNKLDARMSIGQCVLCQAVGGYQLDEVKTIYRNYQKMTI
jgi:DNA replication licensing factor MCM2